MNEADEHLLVYYKFWHLWSEDITDKSATALSLITKETLKKLLKIMTYNWYYGGLDFHEKCKKLAIC